MGYISGENGSLAAAKDAAEEFYNGIFESIPNQSESSGLMSGIPLLDRMTKGLLPGTVTVISGGTGAGKSRLAENIAFNVGVKSGIKTVLVTRRRKAALWNMFASAGGMNPMHVELIGWHAQEPEKMKQAAEIVSSGNLWFSQSVADPMAELKPMEMQLVAMFQKEPGLLIVDGIEPNVEKKSRDAAMFKRLKELKELAVKLNVPVIACSSGFYFNYFKETDKVVFLTEDPEKCKPRSTIVALFHNKNGRSTIPFPLSGADAVKVYI
jgi:replicative DNA helicase